MTTWLFSKYTSSMSLSRYRWICCCYGGIFVAGCTGDCLFDNFRCSRRRRLRRNRHAFVLWLTCELLMSPPILITESFTYSIIVLRYHWLVYFDKISFYFLVFYLEHYSYQYYSYCEFYIVFTIIFNVLLPVCFMYHYLVPLFICIYVYSFIHLFIESRDQRRFWC